MRRRDLKFPIAPGDSRVARCLQGGGVYVQGGTVAISSSTISGNSAGSVRAHALKNSHCPDGKIADVLASTHTLAQLRTLRSTTVCTCHRDLENFPSPHGKLTIARCLQGGGVYIDSGSVTITSSSIHGNSAFYVRAQVQKFPSPPCGRLTFCSLFAGRWCRCLERHGVNRELPDLLQHS